MQGTVKDIVRSQYVGMHELRKNLTSLLESLKRDGQELVITRQGKPTAVIVDLEKYLEVQQALQEFSNPNYLTSLREAKEEIKQGQGVPAEEVFRAKGL